MISDENRRAPARLIVLLGTAGLALAACSEPVDFDLRGLGGGFSTAGAARGPLADRPRPDSRGVISYPNYQVAVARRGDTLADVAKRVGLDAGELARFNGISADVLLRRDEVIALPRRVAEPSPATGAAATGPIQPAPVDITSLAGNAIDAAPQTTPTTASTKPAPAQSGKEPIRHKVERGETAYTIARLYNVPIKALAEWNGLGADFAVREGQFLLVPVPQQNPPRRTASVTPEPTPLPGAGSPTPTPPSAAKPLPEDEPPVPVKTATAPAPEKPVADIGTTTTAPKASKMVIPVQGTIIRAYAKGKNEGIDISASPGSAVKAADSGTVAAITNSADGVPIVVVRHPDNLLTVYANVTDVSVTKGDSVGRGQAIAKLRDGNNNFVHFEVRKGFDSVDPQPYLN